jgi:hypothetical protein
MEYFNPKQQFATTCSSCSLQNKEEETSLLSHDTLREMDLCLSLEQCWVSGFFMIWVCCCHLICEGGRVCFQNLQQLWVWWFFTKWFAIVNLKVLEWQLDRVWAFFIQNMFHKINPKNFTNRMFGVTNHKIMTQTCTHVSSNQAHRISSVNHNQLWSPNSFRVLHPWVLPKADIIAAFLLAGLGFGFRG